MSTVLPSAQPLAIPTVPSTEEEDRPRSLSARSTDDVLSVFGSVVGSFALVWLIYFEILPLSGLVGFIICWFVAFLALYAGVTGLSHPRPVVISRLMGAVVTGAAVLVGFALVTVVVYTVANGRHAVAHLNFFTHDMAGVGVQAPLTQGGIKHAIVGSLIELAIAVAVSLPLGLGTAIFMTEVGGWFAKIVRTVVEAMTAVPELLAGLFVYVTLVIGLGMPKNGLAAAIALSVT